MGVNAAFHWVLVRKKDQEIVTLIKFMTALGWMSGVSRGQAHIMHEVDQPSKIYLSQHLCPDGTMCLYGL